MRLQVTRRTTKGNTSAKSRCGRCGCADPLPLTRRRLLEFCPEEEIVCIEREVDEDIRGVVAKALEVGRPPGSAAVDRYAKTSPPRVKPCQAQRVKNGDAIKKALDYILANHPRSFLLGLDIGIYGSAFKTCKGLFDRYGADRVIDMPLAESAMLGMALGASQVGGQPIMEFQFADFSTEVITQLGLNSATWFYRSGQPAPILLAAALRRRADAGSLSFRRVRRALVAISGPETPLSSYRPGMLRSHLGRLLRPEPLPGVRTQAALLEQERGYRF